jgi:hypothetical protein
VGEIESDVGLGNAGPEAEGRGRVVEAALAVAAFAAFAAALISSRSRHLNQFVKT